MSKRYMNQPTTQLASPDGATTLPLQMPAAVYYRQSTDAQVGNISTAIQTIDMVEHLKRLGWPEDKILLIDMDKGVSGTTKIDEREGMSELFSLITSSKIGAVACQDEDRLFRDVTQIQVNTFIEACREARVLVLTPSMIYDFANPLTGTFHARQFRFKCEMAAEYITAYIKGRLHQAKRRLLLEGRWAGAGMPPGLMVDNRRTSPDGSKNEYWRKFVPFEPYARVVNEYFHLFLRYNGNLRATVKHVLEHGPWYPDPAGCKPPEGFKVLYRMHRYGKGFSPGRVGLHELLTNAAYIGHWAVNDTIVRWNNHPAIVPTDVFLRAFNYRSEVTLHGQPNPGYRPFQEQGRPSKEADRPVERPLCAGMLVSKLGGEWRRVGTNWVVPLKHYTYVLLSNGPNDHYVWSKDAEAVDAAVVQYLFDKLRATFDPAKWQQTLDALDNDSLAERQGFQAQLTALERVMESQVASLDTLTEPDLIRAVQNRYKDAKVEHARLLAEIAVLKDKAQQREAIIALRNDCGPALENWPNLTREEKRTLLHAFIDRIEASPVQSHGLEITIQWRDESFDSTRLRHRGGNGVHWLPDEVERLTDLVDRGADALELAAAFPDRTWAAIYMKVSTVRGRDRVRRQYRSIQKHETYAQFAQRAGNNMLVAMASETCSGPEHRSGTRPIMLSRLLAPY